MTQDSTLKSQQHFQAMAAISDIVNDTNGYPDLGATNHVTPDAQKSDDRATFFGREQLYTGNGSNLQIKHISHSSFLSPFNSKIL